MYVFNENNQWMYLIHFIISLFEHVLAKYLFYALAALFFGLLFLKRRSYGEDSPDMKEAERITIKVTSSIEKILIIGVIGFVIIQLFRIYVI